jgi:hypothetical protein
MAVMAGGNIMPRGDRRGPNGMGPMTGRGAGFCNGFDAPGYINRGAGYAGAFGRGLGRGFAHGGGFGFRSGFDRPMRGSGWGYAPQGTAPLAGYSKEAEKGYIEDEVSFLKDQLKNLEDRLAEMRDDE